MKNSNWSWCMILLIYYWIWFASILLRIFPSMFISNFLSFWVRVSLPGFCIRMMMFSENEVGSVPSSALFWKSFRRMNVNSFSEYLIEFTCKQLGPRLLGFLEVLKSHFKIQYLSLFYSYFHFIAGSLLVVCTFVRICPFLLGCPH